MNTEKTNTQLCPKCKTGKDSYLLDSKSPICPYLHLHDGKGCAKFKEIKE